MKLLLIGHSGRMGNEIASLAPELGFKIAGGLASKANAEANVLTKMAELDPATCDCVIDFSLPVLTADVVAWCVKNKKPLVSGVTGLDEKQKAQLTEAARSVAVFWSSNMSIGIAVVERMLANFESLAAFDFQIEEFHHNRKKDRPSGTALLLQRALSQSVKKPLPEPLAIRGGGIFGMHRVFAMGEEEMITVEHTAISRLVFARGALRAAKWVAGQPAGLYGMQDTLS